MTHIGEGIKMKLTPEIKNSILAALDSGSKPSDVARTFGVPSGSVRRMKFERRTPNAERTLDRSNVRSSDLTTERSFEAPERSNVQPPSGTRTVRTVERPNGAFGSPAGGGAGGANAARTAANAGANGTPKPPPLDPLIILQQDQQFCVDTINSIKQLLGGGTCAILDINYNRVGAHNFQLSPIGIETVKANATFLAPHLKNLFGDNKVLWMVLGTEAAILGGAIYRCYREDHPVNPPPQKAAKNEPSGHGEHKTLEPDANGHVPVQSQKNMDDVVKSSMWGKGDPNIG